MQCNISENLFSSHFSHRIELLIACTVWCSLTISSPTQITQMDHLESSPTLSGSEWTPSF